MRTLRSMSTTLALAWHALNYETHVYGRHFIAVETYVGLAFFMLP